MLSRLKSPVAFLTLSNVFGAGVSFLSGMLVARWMGSAAYGVMGVITAVNTTALNFVDIRLQDLIAKLYFSKELPPGTDERRFRTSIIQSSMVCYAALAFFFLLAGAAANHFLARLFTSSEIRPFWIVASAMGASIAYFMNPVGSLLRLSGRFHLLGWQAMASSVLSAGVMLASVHRSKDLDGYYTGFLASNLVGAAVALCVALWVWIAKDRLPILRGLDLTAFHEFRRHRRFLFWGNILGYVKLGHRAADVLLVGWFCDDRLTGLYKLARTLTDKLYLLFDALNQVYFPTFVRLLADGDLAGYRARARRILLGALALTAVFLAGEALVLPVFTRQVLSDVYAGVEPLIMIMTVPFFFVTGMYTWLWPIILHHNSIGRFTFANSLALALQYAGGIGGWLAMGSVAAFPAGYLGYYVLLIALMCGMAAYRAPRAMPTAFLSGSRG